VTKKILTAFFIVLFAIPVLAQEEREEKKERDDPQQDRFRTELRLNGWWFGNFFQASDDAAEEDVLAGSAEARFIANTGVFSPYLHLNYLQYDESALDSPYGGRVGARTVSGKHDLDLFVDHQIDRPTFDIGDTFDTADVTRFVADYKLRFVDDWQAGIEGEVQQQRFDVSEAKDNDFTAVGASLRWRGSRVFSPEVGYIVGERDVDTESESYDQTDLYFQVRSAPTPSLYLSARYRIREREYTNPDPGTFAREDDRDQITLSADLRTSDHLTWNFYYAVEDAESSILGRDFTTQTALLGLTIGF
jgi:hypothetical protein